MKSLPVITGILLLAIVSCKSKNTVPAEDTTISTSTDTTSLATDSNATYLPIADLLRSDIKRIDSFAGPILKKTSINGKQDSAYIKPQELHKIAEAFFAPELETANFRKAFKESSFLDESTSFLQFMYTPRSTTIFQSIIVYVDPNKSGNNISRVYMEKQSAAGDTHLQQKLTWTFGQYFYIITIKQEGEQTPVTTVEKLIWDTASFSE